MINKYTENPKLKELLQKRQERREQLAARRPAQTDHDISDAGRGNRQGSTLRVFPVLARLFL